ncbi:hypothetical protein J3F84DRAFT_110364 [Trichoderma pleuroticola]
MPIRADATMDYNSSWYEYMAPSRQLIAIGQWEEYCNIQMGPRAKTIHLEGDQRGKPIRISSASLPCLFRVICRIKTMVRSCQKQKLSALPGSPSLCPMRRLIDIRCGSATHGSPSYPTAQYASPWALSFPISVLYSGFLTRGLASESRNWEMKQFYVV